MEQWRPYKARPAPTRPLGRSFETGTLPYELLAGFNATIDDLESLGGFAAIAPYERSLGQRFLDGLSHAVTGTPVVLGGALVVPAGLMRTRRGDEPVDPLAAIFAADAAARARIERA